MQEKQLQFLFDEFLKSKGYSTQSLLYEIKLRSLGNERMLRPDLVILNTATNEFAAIIEFKSRLSIQDEKNAIAQLNNYLSAVGENLPAFLVFPISDDDFQIFALAGNYFAPIAKDEFPTFESLIGSNIASKKNEQIEIEKEKLLYLESKKKKAWLSSVFSILSIIAGVLFTLISIKYQSKQEVLIPISSNCCDSLEFKLRDIEKRIKFIENKATINSDSTNVTPDVKKLNARITVLETGILENPEKTLSIVKINQKIELLDQTNIFTKELMQAKIDALKGEISMQSLWMTGVLIAIFGCILSFTIPVLVSKIKETWLK